MPPVRRRSPRATPRRGRSSSVASTTSVASNAAALSPPPSASKPKRAKRSKAPARPALPTEKNPRLENYPEQPVRLQLIEREEKEIIVGRVKLPSVNGSDHAFLLKRFDTDAVAATSMYRVAFPFANEAAEAVEMNYLESRYDTDVANGGRTAILTSGVIETPVKRSRGRPRKSETPRKDGAATDNDSVAGSPTGDAVKVLPAGSTGVRLQGIWIPASDAAEIAQEYGILKFAEPLIKAAAKMSEDGKGPIFAEPAAQKTPEKKRGRPSKRARKAREEDEDGEQDQLAEGSEEIERPSVGIRRTDVYNSAGEMVQIRLEPYLPGMSEDEDEDDILGSGCTLGHPGIDAVVRTPLSQADIDAQIEEAKALAAGVQRAGAASAASPTSDSTKLVSRGQKRAAANDNPTADLDDREEEDEIEHGRVARALRRGTRVARRRPIATTAGVLTAAGAIGAGAAAYMTGVDVNTAFQTISQTVQSLGLQNWFF